MGVPEELGLEAVEPSHAQVKERRKGGVGSKVA